jgi:hypothetical protein
MSLVNEKSAPLNPVTRELNRIGDPDPNGNAAQDAVNIDEQMPRNKNQEHNANIKSNSVFNESTKARERSNKQRRASDAVPNMSHRTRQCGQRNWEKSPDNPVGDPLQLIYCQTPLSRDVEAGGAERPTRPS